MATTEQIKALRGKIDEPTSDTYDDLLLAELIDQESGDLDLIAADLWEQKAARFSTLVDTSESGSSRSMSQMYKSASAQAKYYADKVRADAPVVVDTSTRARTRTAIRR